MFSKYFMIEVVKDILHALKIATHVFDFKLMFSVVSELSCSKHECKEMSVFGILTYNFA